MIRCSKCGTINRDNSRFCNECGAPLQTTKIRCSACGTLNAVGNVFCDKCNARLLSGKDMVPPMATKPEPAEAPAPSIKGISLPSRQASHDETVPERAELPDWLLELTDESGGAAPSVPEAPDAANLPDWLSSIAPAAVPSPAARSATPAQPAPTELPDWFSELTEEETPAAAPAQSEAATELPDWLSEMALPSAPTKPGAAKVAALPDWLSETAPSTPARPGAAKVEALPDWLSGLETEPGEAEPESELPDWLSAPEPPAAPIPTASKKTADDELPDWLSGLTPEEETAPAETQPDWLSGIAVEEPTSAEELSGGWPEEEEEAVAPIMSDWTSGLADQELTEETFTAETPTFEEQPAGWPEEEMFEAAPESYAPSAALPDWVLAIADDEADYTPIGSRELPSWLLKQADPNALGFESSAPAPLPGWLMAHADPVVSPQRAQPPERRGETAPSRLTAAPVKTPQQEAPADWASGLLTGTIESETAEESAGTEVEEENLPDWLRGLEEEAPAAVLEEPTGSMPSWLSAEAKPDVEEAEGEEIPDWLSGTEEAAETAQEPAFDALEAGTEIEEELPDWLRGLSDEEAPSAPKRAPVAPVPPEAATKEEELPDWLRGLSDEEAPSTPKRAPAARVSPQAAAKEGELPDWLRGVDQGAPSAAHKETPAAAEADWLSTVAPTEAPEEAELPDWLQGAQTTETPSTDFGEATGEPAEAEKLPDWLAGLDTATPAQDGAPGAGRKTHKEPAPARAEVPDWLAAIPQESLTAAEPEEEEEELPLEAEGAEPPATGEIPDWLSNLSPASAEGEEGFQSADENLARAEVPVWLQELRPSGTGPLPPLPEGVPVSVPDAELSAGEAEGLLRAEIPDWLQKLRPTVTADGEVRPSAAMTEEEGPLAGLSGIIFPKAGVDIPDDFQPQPLPQTPDIIVQQAQLWQQLLEQPRGKAHAVSQERLRPGWGIIAMRLLSVTVLFLAILAGLFLSGDRISQSPPDTARPGVVSLIKAIDALEPDDLVILAVEYGPAEAPEMQVMVETLLDHLKERQVRVIAVSTLPEGAGLASSILKTRAITNQLEFDDSQLESDDNLPLSPYLAGTYNGIAKFLSDIEGQSPALLLVVSGRAERTRWWIEQNAIRPHATPLALGVSASTGAAMRPYFDVEEVKGWVVGFADTMTYRTSRGIPGKPAGQLFEYGQVLDSLMLAHWAAICLIIFGFFYSLAAGKQETKP